MASAGLAVKPGNEGTMITACMFILETGGHYRGYDSLVREKALSELSSCRIGGLSVGYVSDKGNEAVIVPCFGHDYRCQCRNPEPNRVMRWFGLMLYLEGEASSEIMGRYELPSGAQIEICGIGHSRETHPLELAKMKVKADEVV